MKTRWLRPGLFVVPALFLVLSHADVGEAFLPNRPIRTATRSNWFNGGVEAGRWESQFGRM